VFPTPPPLTFTPGPAFAAGFPFPGTPGRGKAGEAPRAGRHSFRAAARRKARLRRAADALGRLPAEGEAVHFLIEAYFDPCDLIEVALRGFGAPCRTVRISTLSFSLRNVAALCRWLDENLTRHLTLLGSDWMRDANAAVWAAARRGLVEERGQVLASARCHAKVAALDFGPAGKLVLEGSGNLSSCRTVEQIMVARDAGLHAFHRRWLDRLAKVQDDGEEQAQGEGEEGGAGPRGAAAPDPTAEEHAGRGAPPRVRRVQAPAGRVRAGRHMRLCGTAGAAVGPEPLATLPLHQGGRQVLPAALREAGRHPAGPAPCDAPAARRPRQRGGRLRHRAPRPRLRGQAGGAVPADEDRADRPHGDQAV
jgi:hypothetical protein